LQKNVKRDFQKYFFLQTGRSDLLFITALTADGDYTMPLFDQKFSTPTATPLSTTIEKKSV
jgi:hypothetical protein